MNQVSFNVTADQVRAAARDYLAKGLLTAQQSNGACVYRDGPFRCAVGAVFTDEQLDVIESLDMNANTDSSNLFERLKDKGYEVPDLQEQNDIENIQGCHDMWIAMASESSDFNRFPIEVYEEAEAEDQFRQIISHV